MKVLSVQSASKGNNNPEDDHKIKEYPSLTDILRTINEEPAALHMEDNEN